MDGSGEGTQWFAGASTALPAPGLRVRAGLLRDGARCGNSSMNAQQLVPLGSELEAQAEAIELIHHGERLLLVAA